MHDNDELHLALGDFLQHHLPGIHGSEPVSPTIKDRVDPDPIEIEKSRTYSRARIVPFTSE